MAKVTRRCGCRDDDGRQYGANCPRLKDWRHGTWGFRISAGRDPKTGRRRYLSEAGHRTADDAKEALADAQRGLRRGTVDFTRTRVGDYLRTWLDQQEGQLKPSTHGNYSRYLTGDVIPALGEKLLKDLQRADVAAFVRRLQDDGRGATTVRRIHAVLSSALADAVQDGLLVENVAKGARLPRVDRQRVEVWTPAQAGAFLETVAEHRLGALFELAILTGMRRGELVGLRWSDVDLLTRTITVTTQLVVTSSGVVEGTVKTDAGQGRRVPLSERAVSVLMGWRLRQEADAEEWADAYQESGRVFTWEDGRAYRPDYVSKLFRTLTEGKELPPMHFHSLRHLHASLMLASGQDLTVVAKTMGHSTSQITRDLYAHLFEDRARHAVEGAASLLPSRGGVLTEVLTSGDHSGSDASR